MLQDTTKRIVFLTGPPGIGKTTVVKKICSMLAERSIPVGGFYTEELREGPRRVGFDIVTFKGKRGVLARIQDGMDNSISRYQVGQYKVDKNSFESLALPVFNDQDSVVLVLDEIGRMELFSDEFKKKVKEAVETPNRVILATIPIAKGRPLSFVEELRCHRSAKLFTVDCNNRDCLPQQVLETLQTVLFV
ncbi:cancer-related nucleoside-triphosphatase [Bacillus rossius redtenbacheri]|uniref:cancer-related nucleoside-triphosphatase n=1 Tax=Bacillus rossius redtenbacheri TaxID=93214 RepID=UPI002FDD5E60